MATLRELKGRIGSVASSEKITGAMKMISSAKMHKAEMALRRQRPYRNLIEGIMANLLASDATFSSPLTQPGNDPDAPRAIVVWGSDDGLCGAYNLNIFKDLLAHIKALRTNEPDRKLVIIPIGAKVAKAVAKIELPAVSVQAPLKGISSKSDGAPVQEFLNSLISDFSAARFSAVEVLYMNFQSVSRQRPKCELLLPLDADALAAESGQSVKNPNRPIIFEPDAQSIFTRIIPMFLLASMQEIFVENRASEQAARVMAMQSANDNAKKLLEQLRLEYNKLRQQSITTELLDIVGGQIR